MVQRERIIIQTKKRAEARRSRGAANGETGASRLIHSRLGIWFIFQILKGKEASTENEIIVK